MKKVGRRYSPEMLEEYLEGLETFYLGEGWVSREDLERVLSQITRTGVE